MSYEALRFRITAASPLLMHNGQLADPLNPLAKSIAQIASKRDKTEADHRYLAELEFLGCLYLDGGKPCLPAEMLEAALVKAAAQERRAPKAKAGILIRDNPRLEYNGPTDPHELFSDVSFQLRCAVRIRQSKIMRTRPMFTDWSAAVTIEFLPALLNPQDVLGFLVTAGEQIGIGDWRPRFGRFSVSAVPTTQGRTRSR